MSQLIDDLRDRLKPTQRKFLKYSLVSVVSVVVTEIVLVVMHYMFRQSGGESAFVASSIAAVPSFYLNRNWVWGKSGRSHMTKEVLPFWTMALIGLVFSTVVSQWADDFSATVTNSRAVRTLIVTSANLGAFGVLWILKFVIFNKILFAHREEQLDPAFDGRTGLPT